MTSASITAESLLDKFRFPIIENLKELGEIVEDTEVHLPDFFKKMADNINKSGLNVGQYCANNMSFPRNRNISLLRSEVNDVCLAEQTNDDNDEELCFSEDMRQRQIARTLSSHLQTFVGSRKGNSSLSSFLPTYTYPLYNVRESERERKVEAAHGQSSNPNVSLAEMIALSRTSPSLSDTRIGEEEVKSKQEAEQISQDITAKGNLPKVVGDLKRKRTLPTSSNSSSSNDSQLDVNPKRNRRSESTARSSSNSSSSSDESSSSQADVNKEKTALCGPERIHQKTALFRPDRTRRLTSIAKKSLSEKTIRKMKRYQFTEIAPTINTRLISSVITYIEVIEVDPKCEGLWKKACKSFRVNRDKEARLFEKGEITELTYSNIRTEKEYKNYVKNVLPLKKEMENVPLPHEVDLKFIDNDIGYGIFANTKIKKGQILSDYCGVIELQEDLISRDDSGAYTLEIPFLEFDGFTINARTKRNWCAYINHAGKEHLNVEYVCDLFEHKGELQVRLTAIAMKDIKIGEELTVNYGEGYIKGLKEMGVRINCQKLFCKNDKIYARTVLE